MIGFFYPVVPKGLARIRVQLSAAHSSAHIEKAISAFTKVGRELVLSEFKTRLLGFNLGLYDGF